MGFNYIQITESFNCFLFLPKEKFKIITKINCYLKSKSFFLVGNCLKLCFNFSPWKKNMELNKRERGKEVVTFQKIRRVEIFVLSGQKFWPVFGTARSSRFLSLEETYSGLLLTVYHWGTLLVFFAIHFKCQLILINAIQT
ncbi:hypothetical protein EGR_06184 [Echinococcus granulosus]|uniref:Uncharacterized protein n=1 Tax=Echinococcus granulosus TaxID=6210 RepID=W6UCI8_ECHGR|nr:hypothetical protein EGR_06184 [Echinococcus granulosus]EUB58965.1 hypothetical protein EGR_06184 [Echinococcus granulosus]